MTTPSTRPSGGSDGARPVALVTGARRGLGRAIAICLAEHGFDLVINDLVADGETEETLELLGKIGCRHTFIRHDIGDVDGHGEFAAAAVSAFGRIDCLVNNAGVQVPRRVSLLEIGAEEFDNVIGVNLRGTFFLTQHVARWMAENASTAAGVQRSIISITSSNSALASTDKAAYCIAKAGLSMMTSLFALEIGGHGVGVFEIRPGLMITEMTAQVRDKYADYVDRTTVFRRWGRPDEVGQAVAAIAAGSIPYASGQVINIDGGMHIQRL